MSVVATPALEIRRSAPPSWCITLLSDLWVLTKPEVNFLIVIATFTGFYLGCPHLHPFPFERLFAVLSGTLLVASGAGALNQFLEHDHDARMRRTSSRPVAAGRVRPISAFWFGIGLAALGSASLSVFVNALASSLALITVATYLLIYTPLKRKSPLCTLAGAFPGAIPPLIDREH
jgi:heme o synthase